MSIPCQGELSSRIENVSIVYSLFMIKIALKFYEIPVKLAQDKE